MVNKNECKAQLDNKKTCKIQLKNIVKKYPGVVALNDVSVNFNSGEIHAVVGENGAGKSTMMKAICGALVPTSGEIVIDGKTYTHLDPHLSRELGIEVIYQEITAFMSLSTMENMYMGSFPCKGCMVDKKKLKEETEKVFKEIGFEISPSAIVGDMTAGYIQMVQIAKAISHKPKVLIMDEPTAPLTVSEIEVLFKLVRKLREDGVCIIYISHRMNEIFELADRVTVMRDGTMIETMDIADTNREDLIAKMVGRTLTEVYPTRKTEPGEVVLEVKNLVAPKVKNVSFNVRKGEVLGLAGLIGAGRTETVNVLFGVTKKREGTILMHGKEIDIHNTSDAMKNGILLCPEERKAQGVFLWQPIRFNVTIPVLKRISNFAVVNKKKEQEIVDKYKEYLRIKTPSTESLVRNLSGGNQQKVVIAKLLATDADVFIFDEPTRGIDVGAKFEIYEIINKLAEEGKAIIVISSEMEEIIGLSDRIVVLCEGEVTGELRKEEITQEKILTFASGL